MPDLSVKISELTEASSATDSDIMIIEGAETQKIKWSTIKSTLKIGDVNTLKTNDKSNLVAAINELNDDLGALGNVRLNASGSNGDVQINGYSNRQMYVITVNVGGKNLQVLHVGDTSKTIAHYIVYGNGNLTYFWFDVQANGNIHFVQSWSTSGGWISSPTYSISVYQIMGITAK